MNQIPNIDTKTGIHYGVISYNSIMPEALDDIYTQGENLSYNEALEEARKEHVLCGKDEDFDEQSFADDYQEENDCYLYEKDGYILQTSSLGLYVIKSPFITYCAPCSPCCPNAGDLDHAGHDEVLKTYCLGKDWFEGEAPYIIEKI